MTAAVITLAETGGVSIASVPARIGVLAMWPASATRHGGRAVPTVTVGARDGSNQIAAARRRRSGAFEYPCNPTRTPYHLTRMSRRARPILILLSVFALVLSSAGWSSAGVQGAGAGGHHGAGSQQESHDDHAGHHGNAVHAGLADCEPEAADCADPSSSATTTCCAMACHQVIDATVQTLQPRVVLRAPSLRPREAVAAHSEPSRLDRPPRHS